MERINRGSSEQNWKCHCYLMVDWRIGCSDDGCFAFAIGGNGSWTVSSTMSKRVGKR